MLSLTHTIFIIFNLLEESKMNLKRVLACTLLGITMITPANVATTYAAGETPIRELGHHYGVSVKWDDDLQLVNIDGRRYSIQDICDKVKNGTCMISKKSFHNILHDNDIDHKNCDYEK